MLIAVLAAVGAILDGPSAIASKTHYPQVARLARLDLIKLNALDDGLDGVATMIARAAGVTLVTYFGLVGGAGALAFFGLVAALLLTFSFPRFRAHHGSGSITLQLVGQFICADRLLSILTLLFSIAIGIFVAVQLVVLPKLLVGSPQDAKLLALFLLTAGLASLVGAALSKPAATWLSLRTILSTAFLLLAGGIALLSIKVDLSVIVASAICVGLPSGLIGPLAASIFQMRPPQAMRADVQAVSGALLCAAAPIAVLVAGFAVDLFAPTVVLTTLAPFRASGALFAFLAVPKVTARAAMQPLEKSNARPTRSHDPWHKA